LIFSPGAQFLNKETKSLLAPEVCQIPLAMSVAFMLGKKEVEEILAEIMDTIPELEGIISASSTGKVVAGQTLREMDHSSIVSSVVTLMKETKAVSKAVDQGPIQVLYLESNKGYTVAVTASKSMIVAIAGKDAAASLGLIIRSLRAAVGKISKA
jgi:predicted regulator of Ras-like GTPase activity (Roadblock/LC7/MglB family)